MLRIRSTRGSSVASLELASASPAASEHGREISIEGLAALERLSEPIWGLGGMFWALLIPGFLSAAATREATGKPRDCRQADHEGSENRNECGQVHQCLVFATDVETISVSQRSPV